MLSSYLLKNLFLKIASSLAIPIAQGQPKEYRRMVGKERETVISVFVYL